jgi:hypothetical protein
VNFWDALQASGLATAFIGIAAYFARRFILDWISVSLKFDFESQLEGIKSELREKEVQISALRSGALWRVDAIQAGIVSKRMKAADDLWATVVEWGKFTHLVSMMGVLDFDKASQSVGSEPKLSRMFNDIAPNVLEEVKKMGNLADKSRLHLSDISWALFSAYKSVFLSAIGKAHLLASGLDGRGLLNPDGINDVLLAAIPEQRDLIANGPSSHVQLLEELRRRILEELRKSIEGAHEDAETIARAASIIRVAEQKFGETRDGVRGSVA